MNNRFRFKTSHRNPFSADTERQPRKKTKTEKRKTRRQFERKKNSGG